jgi:hypothetical protein
VIGSAFKLAVGAELEIHGGHGAVGERRSRQRERDDGAERWQREPRHGGGERLVGEAVLFGISARQELDGKLEPVGLVLAAVEDDGAEGLRRIGAGDTADFAGERRGGGAIHAQGAELIVVDLLVGQVLVVGAGDETRHRNGADQPAGGGREVREFFAVNLHPMIVRMVREMEQEGVGLEVPDIAMGVRGGDDADRGEVRKGVVARVERAEVVSDFETVGGAAVFGVGVVRVGAVE